MASDDIAGFHELGLENERQFVFDGKAFSIGAAWTVRGAAGRALFTVKRPAAESVATELISQLATPSSRHHHLNRDTEKRMEAADEHPFPRTYRLWMPDGRSRASSARRPSPACL